MTSTAYTIEVYPSADGYRFRVKAGNGEIVAASEAYTTKPDAERGARGLVAGLSALPTAFPVQDGESGESSLQEVAAFLSARNIHTVEVHHHDIERHAESFNEGYEMAMSHTLMSDDELQHVDPEEWLQARILSERYVAWDEGHHAGVYNATATDEDGGAFRDNPYGPDLEADLEADRTQAATAAAEQTRAELANAWQQGWLTLYNQDRGYDLQGRTDYRVPPHLVVDLQVWNPYTDTTEADVDEHGQLKKDAGPTSSDSVNRLFAHQADGARIFFGDDEVAVARVRLGRERVGKWIRGVEGSSHFRAGRWAKIIDFEERYVIAGAARSVWELKWADGAINLWPVGNEVAGYEFRDDEPAEDL